MFDLIDFKRDIFTIENKHIMIITAFERMSVKNINSTRASSIGVKNV